MSKAAHAYRDLLPEALENVLSNFLVNSWSFSSVSEFARNEKAFEMVHVYGYRSKSSASSVAGNAYHEALKFYFSNKKEGKETTLPETEKVAFGYIENFNPNYWKLQKTTPTVEDCTAKATARVAYLLKNFYSEKSVYEDDIEEVLFVELYFNEFLTLNGVDIPLPCHGKTDLGVKTKRGTVAIIDHKSKDKFSAPEEIKLSIGRQAITYDKGVTASIGIIADEVWFVENKYSQNRDGSPQLNKFIVELTNDTRRLYEALMYEPVKRMIAAVSDPDYVYLINDNDNFTDRAEVYDFWAKTMVAEVEEFNVNPSKKELISKRLKKIRDASIVSASPTIIKEFRKNAAEFIQYDFSNMNMTQQEKIEHALRNFGIISKVAHTFDGYSSNTYLLDVQVGTKIASVQSRKLDLANVLDVTNVRIPKDLVMHEGKSYVAIETAKKRDKMLMFNPGDLEGLRIPIGIDNYGRKILWNLENHSTPHAVVCGATGSGKSVCLNTVIEYALLAGVTDITILDPKYEFLRYSTASIKVVNEPLDIENTVADMVSDMNKRVKGGGKHPIKLVIFDEFADAISQARTGKALEIKEQVEVGRKFIPQLGIEEVKTALKKTGELKSLEENFRILLQKGRSVGFRIMAATQRASAKIINGDTKVNMPVQICFRVPKEIDSKVVLDEAGAESLGGMGDGLMRSPEYPEIVRFQAYFKPS